MTLERLASDIADRIGTIGLYKKGNVKEPDWNATSHYFNEAFSIKVTDVLESLQAAERAGLIVCVTDDVAVFKFPITKTNRSA